jgi:uncharacterized protein YciI
MPYIVHCTDKPGHQDIRLANRAAHLGHLKSILDKVLIAGPTLTEDGQGMTGSLLVLDFATKAEVEAFCAKDPYALAGLFESVVILPYKKVLP